MIIFCQTTGYMISDTCGYDGSIELRKFAKKMRLTRDHLRDEGHPVDEHYVIPPAKHANMRERGALIVSGIEMASYRAAKRQFNQMRVVMNTESRPSPAKPMTPDYVPNARFEARERERSRDRRRAFA